MNPSRTLFAIVAAAACLPAGSAPTVRFVEQETILVRVQPLTAKPADGREDPDYSVEIPANRSGRIEMDLGWPDADSTTHVALYVAEQPPPPGAKRRVRLEGEVTLPDGGRVRSQRDIVFDQTSTAVFELYRIGDLPLTVAVEIEFERETVLSDRPVSGIPVQFLLEIERVEGGGSVPLERNMLNTFVGEPVSYYFRLGESTEAESFTVQITPLRLYGELATVEMQVSGKLPVGDTIQVISRRENWVSSRGTASTITVEAGDPPTGFRFVITPRF